MVLGRDTNLDRGAPLRLGRLSFVNVLPVYLFLRPDGALFREVSSSPSVLNKMLREGLLDVSPASSVEYARQPGAYWVLKDLGISCLGKVRSVLLFSTRPMEEWRQGVIQCPRESETSVVLLRLLLRYYWGLEASLANEDAPWEPVAVLRIGDRALGEAASGKWAFVWDLGEAWFQWTGLPFVFALWLVREEVVRSRPMQLRRLHQALLGARDMGLSNLEACVQEGAKTFGELKLDLLEYFSGLNFGLQEKQIEGLNCFLEKVAGASLVRERPLLRLWPP